MTFESRIKERARELGFDLVGVVRATEADGFDRLQDWLAQGYAGEMQYMYRHAEARRHPASVLPEVRSIIMVAMNYRPHASTADGNDSSGRIAAYALGKDYHDVLRTRLKALLGWMQQEHPGCRGRAVVDTAPLLERDFARRAGLGWIGKNTMLINKRLGSFLFLGALLVDIDLQPDLPFEPNHCGSCTACLDACPTQAFVQPGVLDSRRCISYLTIELRGSIDESLRSEIGDWLFGCDVCQEVCPWNRKAPAGRQPDLQPLPEIVALDVVELLQMDEQEFRRRFGATALSRAGRRGLIRNAAIVLGNRRCVEAFAPLRRLENDADPVIREAAQWAISQILSSQGKER
ncbi:MAG: epoxyqueuosine reductase [Gemmatales bacterium]|nr:MAG: epoxyqueuosine reductase [Gemmatales bacterium]